MESILTDLPPLPRRKITLPLSTLAEVARDVCDGYDPPARRQAYAKAHPLWRELPAHLHALMNALVSVCRGRAGELTLTRSTSLGRHGRPQRPDGPPPARADRRARPDRHRPDPRRRALGRADQGGRACRRRWRPPEPLRLHLAARACRTPAAAAKLARAEAYLRDALLAEATVTGRAPPLAVADTAGRLLA